MNRKEFVRTCGVACIGSLAMGTILGSCTSTHYFAKSAFNNGQLTVKKSEFTIVEKDKSRQRQYVLLENDQYDFPIYLYKHHEAEYSALLLKCTHKGCEVRPQGDDLICPCHGSEFTSRGIVQQPPAEQNLHSFKTTNDDENIYIQL